VTLKDVALGGCCLGFGVLFLLYVGVGVYRFFVPPRPQWLEPAVRETRSDQEAATRREIESTGWLGGQGAATSDLPPPKRVGGEPRPGVSLYEFCNHTGRPLVLYFDGMEIFQVPAPNGASIAVELRTGTYDYLITGPRGAAADNTGPALNPFYRRVSFGGAYHSQLVLSAEGSAPECPGVHEAVRTLE
jgi:hypothetical protein